MAWRKDCRGPRAKQEDWLGGRHNNPAGALRALSLCVGPRSGRPGGSPNAKSIAAGMGVDRERVTDIRLEQLKGWNMPFTETEKILRKAYLGEKDPKLGVLNVDYLKDTVYLGNIRVLIVLCDTLH